MKRAELTELEIDDAQEGLRVHLKRGGGEQSAPPLVNVLQGGAGSPVPTIQPTAVPAAAHGAPAPAAGGALPPGVEEFKSPMVGTFYRSSSPDADPYVSPGTKVNAESTVCILEAMKVMNEIKAEFSGTIVEVLVENAEPVEFGQPLFWIRKGS
jgi:acetyl-CoA carboxylase biotin carboxyl carrier protein